MPIMFPTSGISSHKYIFVYKKGPKFAGSNPAEAVGFFGRKDPQHAFLRKENKAPCLMSQLCRMLKNPSITWKSECLAKFDWAFLAHNSFFR
jgi:hypothetical protein